MNWSAEPVVLVPPGVVTVTSTVPVPAGAVAVIEVAELTVKVGLNLQPGQRLLVQLLRVGQGRPPPLQKL